MSHTHEAGWAHAAGALRGPSWLREPTDVDALVPHLWSSTARKGDDGVLEVGGVRLSDLVAEHGSPAYVLDEQDFRDRARAFRDGFDFDEAFVEGYELKLPAEVLARPISGEGED